jgi:ADP-heptose:LPS heptosyltransferase
LENLIEFSAEARTLHAVDLFAAAIGVELTEGKHLDYEPTPAQRAEAAARFAAGQRKRVAVQLTASSGSRTYPRHLLPPLFAALLEEGFDLVLCGSPGQLPMPSTARVLNLTSQEAPVSFGVTCAVLVDCHAVIAPDSALCHSAAAMGRPVVALYGSFPWKLRTAYQPTVRALTGHAPCAPCFWHARGGQEYPADQPCATAGHCVALGDITPERIVAEIKKI